MKILIGLLVSLAIGGTIYARVKKQKDKKKKVITRDEGIKIIEKFRKLEFDPETLENVSDEYIFARAYAILDKKETFIISEREYNTLTGAVKT